MFRIISFLSIMMCFVLFGVGCSTSSTVETGLDVAEALTLDGEYQSEIEVETGDVFALDMNNPLPKGYKLTGAAFDPDLLRMERFIEYDDDGMRARYLFTALNSGTCDLLIRMRAVSGGEIEVFKHVTVMIDREGGGWFD